MDAARIAFFRAPSEQRIPRSEIECF